MRIVCKSDIANAKSVHCFFGKVARGCVEPDDALIVHGRPLIVFLLVLLDLLLWGGNGRNYCSSTFCLSVPILLSPVALGPQRDWVTIEVLAYLAIPALLNVLEVLGVLFVIDVSGDSEIQCEFLITVVDVIIEVHRASHRLVLEPGRPRCQIAESDQVGAGHHDQKGRPAHHLGLMAGALPLDIGREFLGGKFKIFNAAHVVLLLVC